MSSDSTSTVKRPTGSRATGSRVARRCAWSFAGLAILLASLLVALPFVTVWHDRIERHVERLFGQPVDIATLAVGWTPGGLAIVAHEIRLGGPAPHDASQLAVERATTSPEGVAFGSLGLRVNLWRSLVQRSLVIAEIELREAALTVEYTTDGRLQLAGLERMSSSKPAADRAPRVDLNLGDLLARLAAGRVSKRVLLDRLALRDSEITLVDRTDRGTLRSLPLDVTVSRGPDADRDHRLVLDLDLPPSLGERVSFELALDDARQFDFGMTLSAVDIEAVRRLVAPFVAGSGATATFMDDRGRAGGVRLDAALDGRFTDGALQTLVGDVAVESLATERHADAADLSLVGDFRFQADADGWRVESDALALSSATHRSTVEAIRVEQRRGADGVASYGVEARGARLALSDAQTLARRLIALAVGSDETTPVTSPFTVQAATPASPETRTAGSEPLATWRATLEQVDLDGELIDWQTTIRIERDVRVDLQTRFEALALISRDHGIGFDGLDGALALDDNRGDVTLRGRGLALIPDASGTPVLPAVFLADLDLDFQTARSFRVHGDVVLDDASIETRTHLELAQAGDRGVDYALDGVFDVRDAAMLIDRLPPDLLPPVRRWLAGAVRRGTLENGRLAARGVVGGDAMTGKPPELEIVADIVDAEVRFLPRWPTVSIDRGRLAFDGRELTADVLTGEFDTLAVEVARMRIADVANARVEVAASTRGPLARMVRFANDGPLSAWLGPILGGVETTGTATVDVEVAASLTREPLADGTLPDTWPMPRYSGAVYLDGNDIDFSHAGFELTAARGAVAFDNDGIRMHRVKAEYLGHPVLLDADSEGQGPAARTVVRLAGALDAHRVLRHHGVPLEAFADGVSKWNATLSLPHAAPRRQASGLTLELASDLIGTRVRLPAPLGKPYASPAPIRLVTALMPGSGTLDWRFAGDDTTRGRVVVVDGALDSLGLALGAATLPATAVAGIAIDGTVPSLLLDDWLDGLSRLIGSLPASEAAPWLPPIAIDLATPAFRVGTKPLGAAELRVDTDTDRLRVGFDSAALRGTLDYPRDLGRSGGSLSTRIALIDEPFVDGLRSMSGEAGDALDPRLLPPIDARIARLRFRDLELEDFVMRTSPDEAGLRIESFGFAYRDSQLIGDGSWYLHDRPSSDATREPVHRTRLSMTLQSDDFGSAFSRLGYDEVMNEGIGAITANIGWEDALYRFELDALEGEIEADIRSGRILGVNPGAARIVGLFAFQALPRRLNLDFKDVVLDGLDFERIVADVDLQDGIADARLIQLEGPVGVIDITGESDLLTGEHDQRLTVLPRVSAALPVIGMISGGAGAGIGALLADGLLKAIGLDVDRLGLREYHLHGTWRAPELSPAS